jgi:peptidyl-dipeptidase A
MLTIRSAFAIKPALALALSALMLACTPQPPAPAAAANAPPPETAPAATAATEQPPMVDDALAFLAETEQALGKLWIARERTEWVKSTHITHDTELLAAAAEESVMAFVAEHASAARRFDKLELPAEARRKINLLRIAQTLPSPPVADDRAELAKLATELSAAYGHGKVCIAAGDVSKLPVGCHTLGDLSMRLAQSNDEAEQREIWLRWREVAKPLRVPFARYVTLANRGAEAAGFADLGSMWRSGYDMEPDAFIAEVDRLWLQVEPLYRQLHCFARAKLHARYGEAVPEKGPIPAHLLGNMWAQDWAWRIDDLRPEPAAQAGAQAGAKMRTLTDVLVEKKTTPEQLVRYGEAFFVSLGLDKLPDTFWTRSMFARPQDREVVCHASAWDIDWQDDLRIKMCIEINEEDFVTVHHELGHNYYQRAYKAQPTLFTNSANDGFHEALGDTIALSVTPSYLAKIGLDPGGARSELNFLMQRAVEKVAFLPFGLLVDKWRWQVFSGKTTPGSYTTDWWKLRLQYQGIAPPEPRDETNFDPGGKYHVAASVPYMRYFLAHILQFQLHRGLCKVAGHQGPLHLCSIHGSTDAGTRLNKMMAMGLSQPWPDALFAATGERTMDAGAILEYFAPLMAWLEKENAGRTCGW